MRLLQKLVLGLLLIGSVFAVSAADGDYPTSRSNGSCPTRPAAPPTSSPASWGSGWRSASASRC